MRQADLIDEIASFASATKPTAKRVIEAFAASAIQGLMTDGSAIFPGIGKMVIVERAARKGRNLKTGEVIEIPAKRVVVLKVDRKVSELINAKQWRALTNGER